jgi:hypothetical protein
LDGAGPDPHPATTGAQFGAWSFYSYFIDYADISTEKAIIIGTGNLYQLI